ncbi:hypothetical protein GCM10020331_098390 [Ectobacillus funiculus]
MLGKQKHLRTGNKPYEGTLHLAIKKRFQLDDYYTNSAVQQANALRTSQKGITGIVSETGRCYCSVDSKRS